MKKNIFMLIFLLIQVNAQVSIDEKILDFTSLRTQILPKGIYIKKKEKTITVSFPKVAMIKANHIIYMSISFMFNRKDNLLQKISILPVKNEYNIVYSIDKKYTEDIRICLKEKIINNNTKRVFQKCGLFPVEVYKPFVSIESNNSLKEWAKKHLPKYIKYLMIQKNYNYKGEKVWKIIFQNKKMENIILYLNFRT